MNRIFLLALCLTLSLPAAAAERKVAAQYARNAQLDDATRLRAAAAFLVLSQADLRAPQGEATLRSTWPFRPDGKVAAPNASGIVARALLSIHAATGDEAALGAAKAWARARLGDLEADRPVFDPDIETLALLAKATGDRAYLDGARKAFELRHGMATGEEIVERLFLVRKASPALVGFDGALSARAALAIGEREKAKEIAHALVRTAAR